MNGTNTTPATILLAEDDLNLGQLLQEYLQAKGYKVTLCRDGQLGLEAFRKDKYDLCLFDVMMPRKDGFTLAEEIRKTDPDTPIIFLTAKSMKEDAIKGFKVGADDYINKPFSMEELLLRMKAVLRRTMVQKTAAPAQEEPITYTIGDFTFDVKTQVLLHRTGVEQRLTSKEAGLMELLCQHKNQVLDRSMALKKVWHNDTYFNARSMDVYITKLRKFLKLDDNLQIINVHGEGYKLIEIKK